MTALQLHYIEDLTDHESSWNQLLSKSLDNHPFLTTEWLFTWQKYFQRDREFRLFTAEDEKGVSLAVPVMYSTYKAFGSKRRMASFVCTPDSDYQAFVFFNLQSASRYVGGIMQEILRESDLAVFGEIPIDSATSKLLDFLPGFHDNGFRVSQVSTSVCPYLLLPSDCEVFQSKIGSNMRRNLKVWERNASRDYKVGFVRYDEIGSIKEAMKVFFNLHQKSQTAKGNSGIFSTGENRAFHLDIANAFANKGWLGLYFLMFNDEPVSSIYSYEYNRKLYCYLCGFDPEYAPYRPGHLAFKNLITYGINRGLRELDFLRGDEAYKYRWKPMIRQNLEYKLTKRGIQQKFYNWANDNVSHRRFSKPLTLAHSFLELSK